jgi:hypothetical protein
MVPQALDCWDSLFPALAGSVDHRGVWLLPASSASSSSNTKAADKNRSSPKPPAARISERTFGKRSSAENTPSGSALEEEKGVDHSPFYSLPPSAPSGRYGNWKTTKFDPKIGNENFWDYPVKQPFKVENRKGILTHPAWLIAHSKNTHNDPVVRGKWVREELLAGRVPDVKCKMGSCKMGSGCKS